jgi:hypothetical protein
MLLPIFFDTAAVARTEDGELMIVLSQKLEPRLLGRLVCTAVITCSEETAAAMGADIEGIIRRGVR